MNSRMWGVKGVLYPRLWKSIRKSWTLGAYNQNFKENYQGLLTIVSFIAFKDSLGLANPFNGLMSELQEIGNVLTQEWCYLDLVGMVYLLLSMTTFFLIFKLSYYLFLMSGANLYISNHGNPISYHLSLCMDLFRFRVFPFELTYLLGL